MILRTAFRLNLPVLCGSDPPWDYVNLPDHPTKFAIKLHISDPLCYNHEDF